MKKILLLINPYSRQGAQVLDDAVKLLQQRGHQVIVPAEHKNHNDPNELILKHQHEISHVVIGGGDGSVNAALDALLKTNLPFVVIPLGTANNLARTFSLPTDLNAALDLIDQGEEKLIDVGVVNDIPFLSVAGLGLSTEVNRHVSSYLKKILGVGAFILTAFRLSFKMNPFRAEIYADGSKPIFTKSWQISVCNGKYYGSGLAIKEDASLNDMKLHLLSTEVKKWWHSLKMITSFFTGRFKKEHEVTLISAREMIIKTRRRFAIDVDGDLKTYTPATLKVIPKAAKIVVPRSQT